MPIMNPEGAMKALEDGTVSAIKQYFPMDGRQNRIEASNVYVGKDADMEDTAGQKRARLGGRSWSTGVYGDFRVVDRQTGKVLAEHKGLKVANLPKITRRFSFIVDGKEYQSDHQWRLKSGVYARQRDNGELESQFNLAKGRGFRLDFHPQKSQFLMRYGTTNIQLLPVLRALGKSDEDLKHEFGTAVFARLNAGRSRGDVQKLAKVLDPKYVGTTDEEATKAIKQQFDLTELRADTTERTLGRPYTKVDADTLLASAKKLVNINRGTDVPDNRDALQYKELWSIEDHIPERITNSKARVMSKLRNNVDRPGASVRDIIPMDTFNVPIKAYFTSTSLTQQPNQNNPVDMLGGFTRTTILGPGGISSEQAVTMNAKMIDPSTLGVLDPVNTPEGASTGITAHLTLGVTKRGKEVTVEAYDVRHKRYVEKTPTELAAGVVGFADQFEEVGGKLSARSDMVTALPKGGGDPIRVAPHEVDFVMRSPKSMFSATSNLIPFLPSDQANRAGMAARHIEQSVPLVHREAPLVQVASGDADDPHADTFEKMYGAFASHSAPVAGTVVKVSRDEIVIQDAAKQKHSVGTYDNFPLNEKSAFVDSEPLVKVGDTVEKGDVIADTTATRNGTLALGANMRVGFLPWRGMSVSGDTFVYWRSSDGMGHFRPIREMTTGGTALSVDCAQLSVHALPVHTHMVHAPDAPLYAVTTMEGARIKATGSHSFMTMGAKGTLTEIKPGDMVPGQTFLPRAQPQIPWRDTPETLTVTDAQGKDFSICLDRRAGVLFGLYVSEGYVAGQKTTSIAATEADIIDWLHAYAASVGITSTTVTSSVNLYCAALAQLLLRTCGRLSQGKRVPDLVWAGTREFAEGFLDGYWSGDGTVGKQVTASTASYELAEGLQFLLASLGIKSTCHVYPVGQAAQGFQDQYLVAVSAGYVGRFPRITLSRKEMALRELAAQPSAHSRDRVPIPSDYRNALRQAAKRAGSAGSIEFSRGCASREVLRKIYDELPPVLQRVVDAPLWWDVVADVAEITPEPLVYDLDMRPLSTFLVGPGIVVHNTFEDGIVISESAAKKLTSMHLHKPRVYLEKGMQVNLQKFRANFPGKLTEENAKKLDENGIVRKGQEVHPGDILMTVLKKSEPSAEQVMLKGIHKALARPYRDASVVWDGSTNGIVTDVAHNGSELVAHVRTEEPSDIGDKFCYAPDHELLTSTGWRRIADVTTEDALASLTDAGEIEYVRPEQTMSFDHAGPMYSLETTQVSMLVTPNHRLYARPRAHKGFSQIEAQYLYGTRYSLRMEGDWQGGDAPADVVLPPLQVPAGQGGVGVRTLPEKVLPARLYLALVAAYQSDGNMLNIPKSGSYGIEITRLKEPQRSQLLEMLDRDEMPYTVCRGGKIRVHGKQLLAHFQQFGRAADKHLPEWVLQTDRTSQQYVFDWMMWGDGYKGATAWSFCTCSRRLADQMQRLALHVGMAAKIDTVPAHDGFFRERPTHYVEMYYVRFYRSKLQPTINHGHAKTQGGQQECWADYTGTVHCVQLPRNHTLYTRRGGKAHWSCNSFRHGNKGVCSVVVPDEEMPKNKDGVPLEVILAPDGVPGRINPGQVFETLLGKAAEKSGTTYAVENFQTDNRHKIVHVHGFYRNVKDGHGGKKRVWVHAYDRDMGYQDIVKDALKDTDTPDTEELFDPATGKSFGPVMVGRQYMLKLLHQVEKKLAARSYGYGNAYDATLAPKGGGDSGAQRFGELGTYAMLAHGATANIRDAASYKSDKAQSDVWAAIQTGEPLPAPKTSFAYDKFVAYLNAVGLDVERHGNDLHLVPLTDQQVLERSNGALTDASKVLRGKDLKPEPGGLFDAKITGGPGGKNFSHIKLSEPLPNPVFEKAITQLLGMTGKQFDDVMAGNTRLGDKTGPSAIVRALSDLDVDKELAASEEALKTARRSQLDRAYKRVKYLRTLKAADLTARQAYVQSVIPVIPPVFRPIGLLEGGNLNVDGVNLLYRDLAMMNQKLEESKSLPENLVAPIRQNMYAALEALAGANTMVPGKGGEVKPPGILDILSGSQPKQSYVHTRLLNRRQDLTMRSVITPDQSIDLDQLGIPREGAFEIFKPFVVKELVNMGFTPLAARDEIEKRTSLAKRALDVAVSRRPVLFKRDPVLHKFGIMAFNVKLHDGKAIHIHPLVTGGYNADFDGDTMSVFVPVSDAAVAEARRMLPSENLFDTASGRAMYQPSLAGQLGLYLMTQMGDETKKSFASTQAAVDAAKSGDIKMTDVISVGGKRTTAGRLQVYAAIPEAARTDDVLTDRNLTMEKKGLQRVMHAMATKTPKEYPHAINRLKNLGFGYAHDIGFSYEVKDFDTLHALRADVLKGADRAALAVRKRADLSDKQKDDKLVEIYTDATAEMTRRAKPVLEAKGSKLYMMNKAGVKPSWEQVQQMVLAPMLLANAAGRTIPSPVTRSYSEGLDSAGYWVASSGARKGAVEKVQSVQKPGALSKQIINAVVPYSITTNDCGTTDGIALDVKDTNLLDRYTAKAIVAGHHTYPANTLITPGMLDQLQHAKVSKVVARSALKCTAPHGLCSKCFGVMPGGNVPDVGTNVGVMAGQAFGERGTQLALKEFHMGGLAGAGSKVGSNLDRVIELLKMPETLPNAATLATTAGKVTSVEKNPLGGFDVKVGDVPHYVAGGREMQVKVGDEVGKGDKLSSGAVDPRALMDLTGVDRVQRYMTDELHGAYATEGIRRRNAEVIVKALTNLGTVDDPGDSDEFVRGDPVSLNYVAHQNKQLKNPTVVTPYLRGLETLPLDRSTDWMSRLQYRHLKDTYKRGGAEGWKSDLHGTHPMPGMIYGAEFGKKTPDDKGPY